MRTASIPAAAAGGFLAAPVGAWAQPRSDGYAYWHGPHMMSDGGWWFVMIIGPLLALVFLAALIAVVVFVARGAGGPLQVSAKPPGQTPLDILKERFARGEIDKAEFEERRRVLGD